MRTIRAYNPWPGTYCLLPGEGDKPPHLKIHAARVVKGEACPIGGTVVSSDPKQGLIVSCGSGLLELTEVQVEGGKRMESRSLLRGHCFEVGSRFH